MSKFLRAFVLLLVILTGASVVAARQNADTSKPKPSQHGEVSQRIANTTITIVYNRPVARGRELFGDLVPWGRVWCPCADDATTITLTTDIKVNDQTLAAGTYSVWSEPQPDVWTVIFSRAVPAWHNRYPAGQDVLRIKAATRTGSPMETLAFYFPMVDGHKAELAIHWGTTVVPIAIEVP